MNMISRVMAVALVAVLIGCAGERNDILTIVAPAAPGGGWDQTARTMEQVLRESGLSGAVRVVNVPGAGGTIGLARLADTDRGNGDVLMAMGLIMVGAVLTNDSPVTLSQVTPIARLSGEYEVLVVPDASPYRSLAEFVAAWEADPGAVAIAGGSAGGTDHMVAGLLAAEVGIDVRAVNYVPHSGGGESVASLVGNQVAAGVNGLAELAAFIESGLLRPLGISSDERIPGVDIPTFVEQGVAVTLANWRGVVAAPGITGEQRAALTTLMDRMQESAPWKDALARNNWIDLYQSGPAFDAFLEEENARATVVLRSIGLIE
jgi:putative tricarboxylic transport membrane protein